MKKSYFIIAALSFLHLGKPSLAFEDPFLTLIVGNCRQTGFVKPSVAELVEQDQADFTHKTSFPGRVISVDLKPLSRSISKKKHKHLCLDFVKTSPTDILSRLNNSRPTCIFFEWFPSYVSDTPGKNIAPLLLPALKNAFEILAGGGKVIIDHMPYTLTLPDTEAFRKLAESKADMTHIRQALGGARDSLQQPGFISQQLQKADPFTLHISRGEHEEIRNCLIYRIKNEDLPFNDVDCKYVKDETIHTIICEFANALGIENKKDLMAQISNGLLYSYREEHEEKQGYWDLFEQHYYIKTRGPLILQALQDIGFTVDNNAIQYHAINPYNNRKHAWLLTATKPLASEAPSQVRGFQ